MARKSWPGGADQCDIPLLGVVVSSPSLKHCHCAALITVAVLSPSQGGAQCFPADCHAILIFSQGQARGYSKVSIRSSVRDELKFSF